MELATGEWIQQLHDDYLLPDAGAAMLDAIHRARPDERVLLFGVSIVDEDGVPMRERSFRHERYLEPRKRFDACCATRPSFGSQRWSCTAPASTTTAYSTPGW